MNHLLLRNSAFQVTLAAIGRVLFLPRLLPVCPRAPGEGCRASPPPSESAPSPACQAEGNTDAPVCDCFLSADGTAQREGPHLKHTYESSDKQNWSIFPGQSWLHALPMRQVFANTV